MKKLLVLAFALSSYAWAELKTLDCSYEKVIPTTRITFDLELADAEKQDFIDGECLRNCETSPVKVKVFPSYYRFVWSDPDNFYTETLDLSRKDLTFHWRITFPTKPNLDNEDTGKCELININSSENIF